MEFHATLHSEYLLCSPGLEAEPSNSENHIYHYVSRLCASIIIDQNRMNLSNLDSAFEKTCIPISIPYSQTSCLKAGFVKFGNSLIVPLGIVCRF